MVRFAGALDAARFAGALRAGGAGAGGAGVSDTSTSTPVNTWAASTAESDLVGRIYLSIGPVVVAGTVFTF